jgi:RNA polymerase sigma-70 factor (ECF subfamily)
MHPNHEQDMDERWVAFDAIVSEYEGPLLRYVSRIVHNPDSAQDVVQDTFIRLFRTWKEELTPGPNVLSWLYRVSHNIAVDLLRGQNRRFLLHLRQSREQDDSVSPVLESTAPVSPEAEKAAAAMDGLSLREKQLVILKVYEEKSYREISEITGLTVGNVGYILHNAMGKLAEKLKKAQSI